jgi:hypothetical protein
MYASAQTATCVSHSVRCSLSSTASLKIGSTCFVCLEDYRRTSFIRASAEDDFDPVVRHDRILSQSSTHHDLSKGTSVDAQQLTRKYLFSIGNDQWSV